MPWTFGQQFCTLLACFTSLLVIVAVSGGVKTDYNADALQFALIAGIVVFILSFTLSCRVCCCMNDYSEAMGALPSINFFLFLLMLFV
jgi:hypothetical protein